MPTLNEIGHARRRREAAYSAYLQQEANSKAAAARRAIKDVEESAESIEWKRQAKLLLEDGRKIYGTDAATQSEFMMLVSDGEEARLKRAADLEAGRIRTYSAMTSLEAWLWASFRGVYLYAPIAFILWFAALLAGYQDWKAAIVCGVFIVVLIWQRRRWIDSYARRHLAHEMPEKQFDT